MNEYHLEDRNVDIQEMYDGIEKYPIKRFTCKPGNTNISIMIFIDGFHLFRTGDTVSKKFNMFLKLH